jgi:CDP-diacylglycerol---glycerol-3-phosphate 3-phosphatidyltransferase
VTPTTSKRRLFGLDRSGPKPSVTRRGQPLHPLTIPNLVGYVRLAAIPVFLYLALSSGDGRTAASAILYLAIAGTDYLDGFLARATGQYSRMGALLDPLVDRLTVLAGVVVCWKFELLPRWALALLAARELFMLGLARYAMSRHVQLKVNWLGRWGVWPVFSALFFALCGVETLAVVLLYIGLALVLGATVQYVRDGLRQASSRA